MSASSRLKASSQSNGNGQISTPPWLQNAWTDFDETTLQVWPYMQIRIALRQSGWSRWTR